MRLQRDAVRSALQAGLARPSTLDERATGAIEAALAAHGVDEITLGAIAAILYSRPERLGPGLIERLHALARVPTVSAPAAGRLRRLLEALAATPYAPRAWKCLVAALRRSNLPPAACMTLVPPLRAYVHWRPDLVNVRTVLGLAARPALVDHRAFLLDHLVGPLAYARPGAFDRRAIAGLVRTFADVPRLRYVLDTLASRAVMPAPRRARLAALLARAFPLRPLAAAVLRRRPVEVLAVLNVRIGQGDELTRLAPPLQALLDANDALQVTVITPRPYLYDTPRVRPVAIGQAEAVDSVLRRRFEVVIDIEQPGIPGVPILPAVGSRVDALIRATAPDLVIRGDVGQNHFTYQSVRVAGRELARDLALDRLGADSIYDPWYRLAAELGLSARAGTEAARTPSLLTGTPSAEAAALWARLASRAQPAGAAPPRPVAVVNPFGGHTHLKGFVERQARLVAAELGGLAEEGYVVVLLPNGTPWVGPGFLDAIVAHLPPGARPRMAIAPDPAEPDPARRLPLLERPHLPYADRVMRMFKYFASYADLVCTVEGWLAHLAYDLGRPFRLILAPQSHGFDWHPHGRSDAQRLVWGLSSRGPRYEDTELFVDGQPPPLPHGPRKTLLEIALSGLGATGDPPAVRLLTRAAQSEDYDLRACAIAALGRVRPLEPLKPSLLAALRDAEPLVRRRAAEALLEAGLDCQREFGPRARDLLRAHCDIACQRWRAVLALGPLAFPALAVAAAGANDVIRREAREVARRLLARWAPLPIGSAHAPRRRHLPPRAAHGRSNAQGPG